MPTPYTACSDDDDDYSAISEGSIYGDSRRVKAPIPFANEQLRKDHISPMSQIPRQRPNEGSCCLSSAAGSASHSPAAPLQDVALNSDDDACSNGAESTNETRLSERKTGLLRDGFPTMSLSLPRLSSSENMLSVPSPLPTDRSLTKDVTPTAGSSLTNRDKDTNSIEIGPTSHEQNPLIKSKILTNMSLDMPLETGSLHSFSSGRFRLNENSVASNGSQLAAKPIPVKSKSLMLMDFKSTLLDDKTSLRPILSYKHPKEVDSNDDSISVHSTPVWSQSEMLLNVDTSPAASTPGGSIVGETSPGDKLSFTPRRSHDFVIESLPDTPLQSDDFILSFVDDEDAQSDPIPGLRGEGKDANTPNQGCSGILPTATLDDPNSISPPGNLESRSEAKPVSVKSKSLMLMNFASTMSGKKALYSSKSPSGFKERTTVNDDELSIQSMPVRSNCAMVTASNTSPTISTPLNGGNYSSVGESPCTPRQSHVFVNETSQETPIQSKNLMLSFADDEDVQSDPKLGLTGKKKYSHQPQQVPPLNIYSVNLSKAHPVSPIGSDTQNPILKKRENTKYTKTTDRAPILSKSRSEDQPPMDHLFIQETGTPRSAKRSANGSPNPDLDSPSSIVQTLLTSWSFEAEDDPTEREANEEEYDEIKDMIHSAFELRDSVRQLRSSTRRGIAHAMLDAFNDLMDGILSAITEKDEDELTFVMDSAAVASLVNSERRIQRHGRDTRWGIDFDPSEIGSASEKLLLPDGKGSAKQAQDQPSYFIPETHPVRSILPYVRYLRLIFSTLCECGSWSVNAKVTPEEKLVVPHLVQLLDCMSDQVSSILSIHDDNPYLFSTTGMDMLYDSSYIASNSWNTRNESQLQLDETNVPAGAVDALEAITRFRLILAIMAEGSTLLQKAHKMRDHVFIPVSSLNFDAMMDNVAKQRKKGAGCRQKKGMNDRSIVAAMKLKKLSPRPGSAKKKKSKAKSKAHREADTRKGVAKPVLLPANELCPNTKHLMEWARNIDVILRDMSNVTSTISLRSSSTGEQYEALYYLLQSTIPELLLIDSLEGTETTTAIASAFVRKNMEMHERLSRTETKTTKSLPNIKNKVHVVMSLFVKAFKLLKHKFKRFPYAVQLPNDSRWTWLAVIFVTLSFFIVFGPFVKVLLAVCLAAGFGAVVVARIYCRRRLTTADDVRSMNFFPQLPPNVVERRELCSEIVSKFLDFSVSKSNKTALYMAGVTFLAGNSGMGKTTTASILVRKQIVQRLFPDGIVWLSIDRLSRITYEQLILLYDSVCMQLSTNSPSCDLAKAAFQFKPKQFYLRPEVGSHDTRILMRSLHDLFFDHLSLYQHRVLLVLDGAKEMEDLKWFIHDGKDYAGTTDSGNKYQVLVTASLEQEGVISKNCIYMKPLGGDDAISLVESVLSFNGVDSSAAQTYLVSSIAESGLRSPLGLQCAARLVSLTDIAPLRIGGCANISSPKWWRDGKFGKVEEEEICFIIDESFRRFVRADANDLENVGSILRLCYSAFCSLFYDYRSTEHVPEVFVPSRITSILWDELLNSDEVSSDHLMALDRCVLLRESGNLRVSSRSTFVSDSLVELGLLTAVEDSSESGWKRVKGYFISCTLLRRVGLKLCSLRRNDTFDSVSMLERWNLLMVHGYQEYLPDVCARLTRCNGADSLKEESLFVFRHILRHMVFGGLVEKTVQLLKNRSFVQRRLRSMGVLDGTLQQILDSAGLLQKVRGMKTAKVLNGQCLDSKFVETCIVASFEGISVYLSQNAGDEKPELLQTAVSLYMMGQFSCKQGSHIEAFTFFIESLDICNVILDFDGKCDTFLCRVFARILNGVGGVYLVKNDLDEAIKSFNESLRYTRECNEADNTFSVEIVQALQNLGEAHFRMMNFTESLNAYDAAVVEIEGSFGRDNELFASTLHSMGVVYTEKGDTEKAKESFNRALLIRRFLFGNSSASVARTLHCLGTAELDLGAIDFAVNTLHEAALVWSRVVIDDTSLQSDYADTLHNLGLSMRQQGSLDGALSTYNQSLEIRQSVLGSHHEKTAQTLHNIGIVLCDLGRHQEAMIAYARALQTARFDMATSHEPAISSCTTPSRKSHRESMRTLTNALWGTQFLHIDAPEVSDIQRRCRVLFGSKIEQSTCSSPRIFACASLVVDRMIQSESSADSTPSKKKSRRSSQRSLEESPLNWVTPLMSLITAIVDAEYAVAQSEDTESKDRRVKFCTFDFSSVPSPVDMTQGSHIQLERCIDALRNVVEQINHLRLALRDSQGELKSHEMAKMLLVLHAMASGTEGEALRVACAKSMPSNCVWPASRFYQAAELYRVEFEGIITATEFKSQSQHIFLSPLSPSRAQLSTFIGFAIRFHLRRLFDPVPLGFTMPSEYHPHQDLSACRSRVHEIVALVSPEGIKGKINSERKNRRAVPLWERPISSVLNLALLQLYNYFQRLHDIRVCFETSPDTTVSQTLSQASKRCLDTRSKDKFVNEVDLDDILADIQLAHACLSASRASRFIVSLIRWPGVRPAIEEAGGWTEIESLGKTLTYFLLDRDFPEEAHFTYLHSISGLLLLLDDHKEEMMAIGRASQHVLQEMWKQFKKGPSLRKRRLTQDAFVRQTLVDGSSTALFPQLTTPEES